MPKGTGFRGQDGFVDGLSDDLEGLPNLSLRPEAISFKKQELVIRIGVQRGLLHTYLSSGESCIQPASSEVRDCGVKVRNGHHEK
jgi:hypothetical protein